MAETWVGLKDECGGGVGEPKHTASDQGNVAGMCRNNENKALVQRDSRREEKSWVESGTRLWLLPLDSRVREFILVTDKSLVSTGLCGVPNTERAETFSILSHLESGHVVGPLACLSRALRERAPTSTTSTSITNTSQQAKLETAIKIRDHAHPQAHLLPS